MTLIMLGAAMTTVFLAGLVCGSMLGGCHRPVDTGRVEDAERALLIEAMADRLGGAQPE